MTRGPWTKFGRSVCVGFKSDKSHCRVVQMDDRLPGSRILQIIFSLAPIAACSKQWASKEVTLQAARLLATRPQIGTNTQSLFCANTNT